MYSMKGTILSYYPKFREVGDNLELRFKDGTILRFRFFQKNTITDLLICEYVDDELIERSLSMSFSFDRDGCRELLESYYNKYCNEYIK